MIMSTGVAAVWKWRSIGSSGRGTDVKLGGSNGEEGKWSDSGISQSRMTGFTGRF